MCTPWTRRELTKYFLSCKFPPVVGEEEAGTVCPSSSSAQAPRETNPMNTVTLHGNHNQQEKEPVSSPRRKLTIGSRVEEQEIGEDCIVFCFRDDGAVHVVKDGKPEASSNRADGASKSSTRHVDRELVYGKCAEKVDNSCHGCMLDGDEGDVSATNEGDNVISNSKGKENWRVNLDTASPAVEHRGEDHIEGAEDCAMESAESSESNQSDSSSGSFAFPVLRWEGIGSPVQMPKPEALQLRKPKARAVRLHCCRF